MFSLTNELSRFTNRCTWWCFLEASNARDLTSASVYLTFLPPRTLGSGGGTLSWPLLTQKASHFQDAREPLPTDDEEMTPSARFISSSLQARCLLPYFFVITDSAGSFSSTPMSAVWGVRVGRSPGECFPATTKHVSGRA